MIRPTRRHLLRLAAGAAAFPSFARIAGAQGYPSRPITLITPSAPGAPSDVVARIIVEGLRPSLGQPVVIDNVAGANGTIGIGRLARAKPDGYTLALSASSATHVVNGAIYALPYDVVGDFAP